MITELAAHKRELESELRERVRAFFEVNNEAPESVSIEMLLDEPEGGNGLSSIQIVVKDSQTGETIMAT